MTMLDPIAAAKEGGVTEPVLFLANARSGVKPWIVYGAGGVVDQSTLDADDLAQWRAEGFVSTPLASIPTPPAPPVISNVVATPDAADGTQCVVTWTTDVASDSQVHYGATNAYGSSSTLDSAAVTSHTVTLTGLTAATAYHFAAASGGTTSPDGTFTTV